MEFKADIPDELVPYIAEAFYATYPNLVGMTPTVAVRAQLIAWVKMTVLNYAADQARVQGEAVLDAAEQKRQQILLVAQQRAELAVSGLDDLTMSLPDMPESDPPAGTVEENTETP